MESAHLCGRGASKDPGTHGLQRHRTRMRRPVRRCLRHQGADARAGGHGHPGSCELHGGIGQALPSSFLNRDDARGRHLHYQRSLAGNRTYQRLRSHDSLLQSRASRRALFLHVPYYGHRRCRHGTRRHGRAHGRHLHPDAEARRPGGNQRDSDGDDSGQYTPARGNGRRCLLAGRLQRYRLRSAGRDDGRIRFGETRLTCRIHLRQLLRCGDGRNRRVAEGHLPQHHAHRRIRQCSRSGRGADHFR